MVKINGKLSKEQIDLFILEKYNSLIITFIGAMALVLLIFVPITIGLDNNMAFFAILIAYIIVIIGFIFLVKYLRNGARKKLKDQNKNYVFEFKENEFEVKNGSDTKIYIYKKICISFMKNFYIIEISKKEKYIVPKKNLSKEELKEIKKHFI